MAGDSNVRIPEAAPAASPLTSTPAELATAPVVGANTGITGPNPQYLDQRVFFNADIQGYINGSGGTQRRLEITAPKAPRIDPSPIQNAVPQGARSLVDTANGTTSTITRTLRRGADEVLRDRERLDGVTPLATFGAEIINAGGKALIKGTPSGVGAGVNKAVIATNRAISDLIPPQANFHKTLTQPIVYDDKHGTRMLIQPGATLVGENGVIRLLSDGGYLSSHGVTVAGGHTDITVGRTGQKLLLDRFFVQDGSTKVDVEGIQTILGTNGTLISRADKINVDLARSSVRISGAQIASPDAHTLTAGFDQLAVRSRGTTVDAGNSAITAITSGANDKLAATINDLNVVSGKTHLSADTMTLSLSQNRNTKAGALQWITQGLHYTDGTNAIDAATGSVGLIRKADGSSILGIHTRDASAVLGNQQWVTKGNTTIALGYDSHGRLTDVGAKGDDVAFTDAATQLRAQGSYLHAAVDGQGRISSVDAGSKQFNLVMRGGVLAVSNSRVDVARDGDAVVLKGTAMSGRYSDGSGIFDLGRNGSIDARITKDTVNLSATASQFTYANKQSQLALTNGHVEAAFGAGVPQEYIRFNGDHVAYTGSGGANQPASLVADNATASLTRDHDGAMTLALGGKNVAAVIDGNRVGLTDVKNVDVITNAAGKITNIDAVMPGSSSFVSADGKNTIQVDNLNAHYTDNGQQRVRMSFDRGAVVLGAIGLSGEADDVKLAATAHSLRASIANGNATMNGVSVRLSDVPGQHIRLSARTDQQGVFQEARLVVPNGGQLVLASSDFGLRLGESNSRLTQHDGTWRLDSRNFDVGANWNGGIAAAHGERFDASLAGNQLIFNHIRNTDVNARIGGYNVGLDIKQADHLTPTFQTISGFAQGAAIALEPTKNNSLLTASARTTLGGIPISLQIDNARAFEGLALVQPNQARIQLGDPKGQGYTKLTAGPFRLEGKGVIGAVATYHHLDEQVLAQDVIRMGAGYDVTPNLRISPDGAFTLHTAPRDTPLYLSGTFLAPLDPPYPWQSPTDPNYQNNLVPTQVPGFIARVGVQREVRGHDGKSKNQGVFVYAGLTGAAFGELDFQGKAEAFGVELPNQMRAPALAQGGIGFENGPWRGTIGVHATPAAAVPEWVRDHPYGFDAAVNYERGKLSAGVGLTVDPNGRPSAGPGDRDQGPEGALMAHVRWAFP